MSEIKSLADQLRDKIAGPGPAKVPIKEQKDRKMTELLQKNFIAELASYDNSTHKHMVHIRFDQNTAQLLSHFKMASGIDTTKLVSFAVHRLLQQQPEIKSIVKQFLQNFDI